MSKDTDFELGNETNIASLLIVGAATLGGIALGWFSKHYLGRRKIRDEIKAAIKTMTREEINQIFSGTEEPKSTVKHMKIKDIAPV